MNSLVIDIKKLYKVCKILKSENVCIYDNIITDATYYPVNKFIYSNISIGDSLLIIPLETLKTLSEDLDPSLVLVFENNNLYVRNDKGLNSIINIPIDYYNYNKLIMDLNNKLSLFNNMAVIKRIEDLKSYEAFSDALNLSADDGCNLLTIENYCITYFKGLLPINKSDKVSLEILQHTNNSLFVGKFIIIKPGNIVLNYYITYFNL